MFGSRYLTSDAAVLDEQLKVFGTHGLGLVGEGWHVVRLSEVPGADAALGGQACRHCLNNRFHETVHLQSRRDGQHRHQLLIAAQIARTLVDELHYRIECWRIDFLQLVPTGWSTSRHGRAGSDEGAVKVPGEWRGWVACKVQQGNSGRTWSRMPGRSGVPKLNVRRPPAPHRRAGASCAA